MRHEPIQPGNPHKITVRQHVLPRASIARFGGKDGLVEITHFGLGIQRQRVSPDSDLFCCKRVWDQRAESGHTAIEDEFQKVADRVLSGYGLRDQDFETITRFAALWRGRSMARKRPLPDQILKGVLPGEDPTKDEQEIIESRGGLFVRGVAIPGRQVMGIHLQRHIDETMMLSRGLRWGIIEAKSGEFMVPDTFRDWGMVPVNPKLYLRTNSKSGLLPKRGVVAVNREILKNSNEYFFAKDLANCPK